MLALAAVLVFAAINSAFALTPAGAVVYNGIVYRTLDGTPYDVNRAYDDQDHYISLPEGWALAEELPGVVDNVIAAHPWGANCLIFASGKSYWTTNGDREPYEGENPGDLCYIDVLDSRGNMYKPSSGGYRILIAVPSSSVPPVTTTNVPPVTTTNLLPVTTASSLRDADYIAVAQAFLSSPTHTLTSGVTFVGHGGCLASGGDRYSLVSFHFADDDGAPIGVRVRRCGKAAAIAKGLEPAVRGVEFWSTDIFTACEVLVDVGFAADSPPWGEGASKVLGSGAVISGSNVTSTGSGEVASSNSNDPSDGRICYKVEAIAQEERDADHDAVRKACEGSGNGHDGTAQTGSVCCPAPRGGSTCCTATGGNDEDADVDVCCMGPSGGICSQPSQDWQVRAAQAPSAGRGGFGGFAGVATAAAMATVAVAAASLRWKRSGTTWRRGSWSEVALTEELEERELE